MNIVLQPDEEKMLMEVATNIAGQKGISPEEAIINILALGISSWREEQLFSKLKNTGSKEL